MKRLLVCLPFILLSVMLVGSQLQAQDAAKPELRTWKDLTGQFSVEAVFVRVSGDQVVLQRKDKAEISVPLTKLSAADRKYVQNIGVLLNSIGMKLKLIPAGEFIMGSPGSEPDRNARENQHRVKITKPFYLAVHEVTQQQYDKVMGARPWEGKGAKEGADYPASYISHDDAVDFCRRLSKQEDVEYRLPTEAEWEYACRGGTTTIYSFGDDASKLGQYGWHEKNAKDVGENYAHRVGQKFPNPWGLYDMHGNVDEWCQDIHDLEPYDKTVVSDPMGPTQGKLRIMRGGSFSSRPRYLRSANRNGALPSYTDTASGFRVARTYSAAP